jgi:hypothetical protein
MKLYKGKLVTEATKEQVPLMEKHGWSRTAPEAEEVKEDTKADETKTEETPDEEVAEKELAEKAAPTAAKTTSRRKPIKKI